MMRSSRGERPPFFSGWAKSSSSARSSSRSMSVISSLVLEADKGGGPFRHPLFPRIGRSDGGKPSPFLLEPERPDCQIPRVLRRQAGALTSNRLRHLFQTFLVHRLGEDRIGFAERIDPVDKVDVEFAHVHRVLAHPVDERSIGALSAIAVKSLAIMTP